MILSYYDVMGKRKVITPPKISVETRNSKLIKTMEGFTEAVRSNQSHSSKSGNKNGSNNNSVHNLAVNENDDAEFSSYEILKNLGADMKLLRSDVSEMKNDIRAINDNLNGQNERLTAIESFIDDTKLALTEQQATNTAVINRLDSNEALIKSKQAVFTAKGVIDTSKENFRKTTRDFLMAIGLDSAAATFTEINKFGNPPQKNTVVLAFPTVNSKIELYKHFKKFKSDQSTDDKSNFYMNDLLTQKKLQFFKHLKDLQSKKKVHSVYTFRNNVYVKVKDKDDESKLIQSQVDIDDIISG